MLALVRYQRDCQKKAAGAEDEVILSAAQVMASVEKRQATSVKYYDVLQATFVCPRSRKEANIIYHKWF